MKNKKILAMNNAFSPTLIAFGTAEKMYFSVRENPSAASPNNILFIVDELFRAFSLSASDIDAISVVNGPGSFTGTRIAVVEAKIISFALSIPLITINSLELIGSIIKNGTVVIPAGRGEFFVSSFKNGVKTTDSKCVSPDKIKDNVLYSISILDNGKFEGKDIRIIKICGEDILAFSHCKLNIGETVKEPLSLKPLYLRSTDLIFKKKGKK
jgi:tRNA threonylcarbamoyl adenosine modification protein YeaZ